MSLEQALGPYLESGFGHALAGLLGALFGSFANVCIFRMPPSDEYPLGRSVATPGSHCGQCQTPIKWYDNIPLLSYFILRGKCRHCGAKFSPSYLFVEGLMAILFVALFHAIVRLDLFSNSLDVRLIRFSVYAAFAFILVVVTFIDLAHLLILDRITFPGIPAFYMLGLLLPETQWWHGLLGAAVGYGIIRAISDGYRLAFGREGMGAGDGKLLALIGALAGWQAVAASLAIGSFVGVFVSIPLLVWARRNNNGAPSLRKVEIPFGPYLAIGALVYVAFSPHLRIVMSSYSSL